MNDKDIDTNKLRTLDKQLKELHKENPEFYNEVAKLFIEYKDIGYETICRLITEELSIE
jgi:hypothetical protein